MTKKEQKEAERIERLAPDTSVIIEGLVSKKVSSGELLPDTIIIHEAVVSELEHQANMNKAIGFLGLDELVRIRSKQPIERSMDRMSPGTKVLWRFFATLFVPIIIAFIGIMKGVWRRRSKQTYLKMLSLVE